MRVLINATTTLQHKTGVGHYVAELIQSQVLVSNLTPDVTGPEAIHGLEERLAALPSGRAAAGTPTLAS